MSDIKSLGQVAFEAYRAEVVTARDGSPIPPWGKLDNGAPARRGWEAAAQAIREHMQMVNVLDATADRASRDFRDRQQSRWQPVDFEPVNTLTDYGQEAPGGRGDAPTGKHVAVEAGPDEGR